MFFIIKIKIRFSFLKIQDANVDKSLRPYCFCVFSDIFISCGDYLTKYLGGILELVTKALEAATVPVREDVSLFKS